MNNNQNKVLICEDDKFQAFALQKTIESLGLGTELVDDGMKVLEFLNLKTFHLLIIDMNIQGLKGVEVIHFIRNTLQENIPIFVVSGLLNDELSKRLKHDYDVQQIISKPFSHDKLKYLVKEQLDY